MKVGELKEHWLLAVHGAQSDPGANVVVVVLVVVVVVDWQPFPLHVKGAIQSAVVAQLVLQLVAPHTYGEHDDIVPAVQLPLPSQVLALVCVSVPALHDAATQTVPAAHC